MNWWFRGSMVGNGWERGKVACRMLMSSFTELKVESVTPVSHHECTQVSFSRKITTAKESTYLWPNEKLINPKYLIRVAHRAKSIPERRHNLVLDPTHALVVCSTHISAPSAYDTHIDLYSDTAKGRKERR